MRCQTEHNKVRVQSVQAVPQIGLPVGAPQELIVADVRHDLVLPLPRLVVSREDDRNLPPPVVVLNLAGHKILNLLRQPHHKLRPRCDGVRVKLVLRDFLPLQSRLLGEFLVLQCGPEAPRPLLVHFGARSHAVYRHVQQPLGPDEVEYNVEVRKDILHHDLEAQRTPVLHAVFARVDAAVDDAVHVQVEVIKHWHETLRGDSGVDEWHPARNPPVKLWHSHGRFVLF
mmetsp:Transcript_11071/g.31053  ORF Transcript_11071/g.31053 Transcript_11071/m.31053 type:complete len:228 (+) Transcript_11071:592-1275(+)